MEHQRHYNIIGPGAVGCYMAFSLHRAGFPVTLVDYRADRAQRLSQQGIQLTGEMQEDVCLNIPIFSSLENLKPGSISFVCIKSYSATSFMSENSTQISRLGRMVFVQNGISWIDWCSSMPHVCAGGSVAYFGVSLENEGAVRLAGNGPLYIGPISPDHEELFSNAARDLNAAGINAEAVSDIRERGWEKLLVNLGINPLTVLYSCRNGELLDGSKREQTLEAVVSEGVHIARAAGLDFDIKTIIEKVKDTCRITARNISSMLQDVQSQKQTELESITGSVLNKAEQYGIDIPENRNVYSRVRNMTG